jgi:hypothetical protein
MRKIIKETKSIDKLVIICDDCGQEVFNWGTHYTRTYTCCMCHKDLCGICYKFIYEGSGDHPVIYCESCLSVGKVYRDQINKLERECEEKIDLLEKEWREKCLEREQQGEEDG